MHARLGDDDGHADEHDEDLPIAAARQTNICTTICTTKKYADQDGDDELEEHDRLPVEGVPHREEDEDVRAGQQHAGVERDPGEEQAYCDGGAEQLGEVGRDDGDLGEGVQRVEHEPAPEKRMLRPRMQEDAAVGSEVWITAGECIAYNVGEGVTYRGLLRSPGGRRGLAGTRR